MREQPGGLRYWGPEVDIWCVGLTLLRCLTPQKYPLGIAHSSLPAIQAKVTDALLSVANEELRGILAGLLSMNGERRMDSFSSLVRQRGLERNQGECSPEVPMTPLSMSERQPNRPRSEFKSTTFVPTPAKHSLDLPLLAGSQLPDGPRPLEVHAAAELAVEGVAHQAPPPPVELVLLNPTDEPIQRAASYVKYALRCAGVLYHVREDASVLGGKEDDFRLVLECVVPLPRDAAAGASKASNALIAALRPSGPVRSSSVPAPPPRAGGHSHSQSHSKKKEPPAPALPTLRFFVSIRRSAGQSRRKANAPSAPRVVLSLSDIRARGIVRDALKLDHVDSPTMHSPRASAPSTPSLASDEAGRRGRGARGEAPAVRTDGSGSRAARERRSSAAAGAGLAMSMGPAAVLTESQVRGGGAYTGPLFTNGGKVAGFFDFFSSKGSAGNTPAGTPAAY